MRTEDRYQAQADQRRQCRRAPSARNLRCLCCSRQISIDTREIKTCKIRLDVYDYVKIRLRLGELLRAEPARTQYHKYVFATVLRRWTNVLAYTAASNSIQAPHRGRSLCQASEALSMQRRASDGRSESIELSASSLRRLYAELLLSRRIA